MPQSPGEPRHSRRDEDSYRRQSSRHGGDSRHHRPRRSFSPRRSPHEPSTTREGHDSVGSRERASSRRRHRSPHKRHSSSHHTKKRDVTNVQLPFSARPLTKVDLSAFEPLFAEYLDLQKQKLIEDMDEREIRGRWKSFVGKWNRNELAEGWYDPEMFQRILERGPVSARTDMGREPSPAELPLNRSNDSHSDGEDYGPVLPGAGSGRKGGVSIPSLQDLALRNELIDESREAEREELRASRKADRTLQKERLEELVPRADAGTRERKLEKRQEVNEKMRQFREKSPGMEVGDKDLMGGGDGLEEYKQAKEKEQKRKSEREVRREELARARREEIEEKRRAWQQREDKTVSMLKELAKQRFG